MTSGAGRQTALGLDVVAGMAAAVLFAAVASCSSAPSPTPADRPAVQGGATAGADRSAAPPARAPAFESLAPPTGGGSLVDAGPRRMWGDLVREDFAYTLAGPDSWGVRECHHAWSQRATAPLAILVFVRIAATGAIGSAEVAGASAPRDRKLEDCILDWLRTTAKPLHRPRAGGNAGGAAAATLQFAFYPSKKPE